MCDVSAWVYVRCVGIMCAMYVVWEDVVWGVHGVCRWGVRGLVYVRCVMCIRCVVCV